VVRVRKWTDIAQLKVRLSPQLRERMEAEAARNNRSMNAEIVTRLERSLQRDEDKIETAAQALVAGLDDAIIEKIVEIVEEDRASMADYDAWSEAEAARREEEIELRAQELLAERKKEKDSK
jgi:hypothetical protein